MSKFKIGDKVLVREDNILYRGIVTRIKIGDIYPIKVIFGNKGLRASFTYDGKEYRSRPITLFHDISYKINKLLSI